MAAKSKQVKSQPAPVAPVAAPMQAVSVQRGLAVTTVALSGKPYRIVATDKHNPWWATINEVISKQGGSVKAILDKGVPGHYVGYVMRRGYLTKVS